jgi:hypothetical protein
MIVFAETYDSVDMHFWHNVLRRTTFDDNFAA